MHLNQVERERPVRAGAQSSHVAAVAASLLLTAGSGAAVVHVDDDAAPGGDGSSWSLAFQDVQQALAAAQPGDEIWVAAGTYRPALPGGDRMVSFDLANWVRLYGGFAGWETQRNERDWIANETILSGDLNGDDGPDFTGNSENSYHVVTARALTGPARLDGFIVTAGNADWPFDPDDPEEWYRGSGVFIDGSSPSIVHCTFRDNWAIYGAVYSSGGAPTIDECAFTNNFADVRGGAIRGDSGSEITVLNSMFQSNAADSTGGAIAMGDGGMLSVVGCTFLENVTGGGGGAGIMTQDEVTLRVETSTFRGNQAGGGAAIFLGVSNGPCTIINCDFVGNDAGVEVGAGGAGGAFAAVGSHPITFVNCAFVDNSANYIGGAIVLAAPTTFINCTLSGNVCTGPQEGGAIYVGGYPGIEVLIYNSILWNNAPDQIQVEPLDSVYAEFCNVQGGWSGPGNIDTDPLFVQPGLGDLRLSAGSPCLDAGDNSFLPPDITTDLDGSPRIQNGTVDMGAYEGAFEPLPPADGDGDLDQGEIVILIPEGGGYDPIQSAAAFFANMTGPDNASVMITQLDTDEHPGAGGYSELSWILNVDTSLQPGELYMQISIPFAAADLDGADPLEIDLTVYDPDSNRWVLAVAGNTVNSPGHDAPIGDRFAIEGDTLPPFSSQLGDYGVFFNPDTGQGVAWAVVDHASDFGIGIDAACVGDIATPADDMVDVLDLAALLEAWGPVDPPGGDPADLDGDGSITILDLLLLLDAWGACP